MTDPPDPNANPRKRRSPPPSSQDFSILPDALEDANHSDSAELIDNKSAFTDTLLGEDDVSHATTGLLRDLATRPITVSQLIQEVKGIYAGLGKLVPFVLICANQLQLWLRRNVLRS